MVNNEEWQLMNNMYNFFPSQFTEMKICGGESLRINFRARQHSQYLQGGRSWIWINFNKHLINMQYMNYVSAVHPFSIEGCVTEQFDWVCVYLQWWSMLVTGVGIAIILLTDKFEVCFISAKRIEICASMLISSWYMLSHHSKPPFHAQPRSWDYV